MAFSREEMGARSLKMRNAHQIVIIKMWSKYLEFIANKACLQKGYHFMRSLPLSGKVRAQKYKRVFFMNAKFLCWVETCSKIAIHIIILRRALSMHIICLILAGN